MIAVRRSGKGTVARVTSAAARPSPLRTAAAAGVEIRAGRRATRLLVFTSLYPNTVQPRHGIFIEERLRKLIATGRIVATVVAPVPWFPFRNPRFGTYSEYARVPRAEDRHGIRVLHPRYPVLPKIGMNLAPALMYRAVLPVVRRLLGSDPGYDVIDAHYLYPDGVAAVAIGRKLSTPVVVSARGSDVTLLPRYPMPRARILAAVARADAVITVSESLRGQLIALEASPDHIATLRNGVDLERFRPVDARNLRATLAPTAALWLTVGNLIELKGVHLAIAALVGAPDVTLAIAGDGPERAHLEALAERLGVASRVRFLGAIPPDELTAYYCAADALVQASSREGMPNVVLEALACGTPVIAAPFAGVDELLSAPAAGAVAAVRTAPALVDAWHRLRAQHPDRAATRRYAEQFGWNPVIDAQCALYARVAAGNRGATA